MTRYALFNAGITWSNNGKLAFLSERARNSAATHVRDVAAKARGRGGAVKSSEIDWDDIHLRVFQPTTTDAC